MVTPSVVQATPGFRQLAARLLAVEQRAHKPSQGTRFVQRRESGPCRCCTSEEVDLIEPHHGSGRQALLVIREELDVAPAQTTFEILTRDSGPSCSTHAHQDPGLGSHGGHGNGGAGHVKSRGGHGRGAPELPIDPRSARLSLVSPSVGSQEKATDRFFAPGLRLRVTSGRGRRRSGSLLVTRPVHEDLRE